MNDNYILTADIGGSHITSAVCNINTNTILSKSLTRIVFSSKGAADLIFNDWENAFKKSVEISGLPISGLGIAMPGPFDYENGVSYIKGLNKYEALYGMDIRQRISGSLQLSPSLIRFRNDAEATIAGEVLAGAGQGFKTVMGLTLGTGFGSAYFSNGKARDLNLGSSPFKDSIADDHLSTRWFLKRYYDLTGISTTGVKEMAELAAANKTARAIFKEFAHNLSDLLKSTLMELKPDVLVICGNIARASPLFLPQLKNQLSSTHIVLGQLGENAALIGAAGLFVNNNIPSPDNSPTTIT